MLLKISGICVLAIKEVEFIVEVKLAASFPNVLAKKVY